MLCDALIALLFIVLPLRYFFPVDPETDAGTPVIGYIDDEPFLPEQPGKPPPTLITRYRLFLLYTACSRVV